MWCDCFYVYLVGAGTHFGKIEMNNLLKQNFFLEFFIVIYLYFVIIIENKERAKRSYRFSCK